MNDRQTNNCQEEMIRNKADLYFGMLGKSYKIESNQVVARKVDIRVIKEQSQNIVFAGDKICYKITVYNQGCVDLCDLDFKDNLAVDVDYERNSFKVNGECKNPEIKGHSVCYHINQLKAKENLVITFDVCVH